MATTYKYEADYFQLNTSVDTKGDCAVILLVKRKATGPPTDGQELISAVLLDVGSNTRVIKPLIKLIHKISADYVLPDAEKQFCFDSIIITHWDEVSCKAMIARLPF